MSETKHKKKLLTVDDSPVNRALLKNIFCGDFDVIEAENGESALELLKNRPSVEIILLDLSMPVLDGFGVLERLREDLRLSRIPVVVISASDDDKSCLRALNLGAQEFITIPFSPEIVLRRVLNLVERIELIKADEELRRQNELMELLKTDEKTGLYNKQTFLNEAGRIIKENPETDCIIIRCDIDHFKLYNDAYGTSEGDRLLAEMGRLCRNVLEKRSEYFIAARFEADHFVFLRTAKKFDATHFIRYVTDGMKTVNSEFDFVVRLGIYEVSERELDTALMCDRALLALKSVKNIFSKRFARYERSMLADMIEKQELTDGMKTSLDNGDFVPYIQPQYDFSTGKMIGAEVLVRWFHPKKGLLTPSRFIPLFENNGFITNLDTYMWEQSCLLLRRFIDNKIKPVPLSVNVSRKDIYNTHLLETLCSLTEKYHIDKKLLRLEITESAYMENPEQMVYAVELLRKNGFLVEMDDFGSGYSSLNTLKSVPVDLLKLDMRFLSGGKEDDPRGGTILSSVVRMARWLGLQVMAEGIETKKQADYLKSIGCVYMQGFYFNKPMPAVEFEELLKASCADREDAAFHVYDIKGAASFLDLSVQSSLLFNGFVGGAAIIEYDGTSARPIRINDRYFMELCTTRRRYDEMKDNLLDRLNSSDRAAFCDMFEKTALSQEEHFCDLYVLPASNGKKGVWLHTRARFLAKTGMSHLFYLSIENISYRVELENKNHELAERLGALIETVPGGISNYTVTPDGITTTYVNAISAETFGYSESEYTSLFAETPYDAVHPDDKEPVRRMVDGLIAGTEKLIAVDYRHICKNGSWRWTRMTGKVMRRDGDTVFLSTIHTDINDSVKKQQKTQQQLDALLNEQLCNRMIINTIPCGIIQFALKDGRYHLVDFNEAAYRVLGYENENQFITDIRKRDKLQSIHPADVSMVTEKLKGVYESAEKADFDSRIIRKDGEIRWVRTQLSRVGAEKSEYILQCVFNDITDRKKDYLRRYTSALFGVFDEVYEYNSDSDTLTLRSTRRLGVPTGIPEAFSEKIAAMLSTVADGEDCGKIQSFCETARTMEQTGVLEFRYRINGDAADRWASMTVLHIDSSSGLMCFADITQRKKAEKVNMENAVSKASFAERRADDERSRLLIENTGFLIFDYNLSDDTMKTKMKNQSGELVYETIKDYIKTLPNNAAIIPADRTRLAFALKKACEKAGQYSLEYRTNRFGKEYRSARLQFISVSDSLSEVYRIVGISGPASSKSDIISGGADDSVSSQANPFMEAIIPSDLNDITENTENLVKLIFSVHDEVSELSFEDDRYRLLHSRLHVRYIDENSSLTEVLENWGNNYVFALDRDAFSRFTDRARLAGALPGDKNNTLEYRIRSEHHERVLRQSLLRIGADRYLCLTDDITEQRRIRRDSRNIKTADNKSDVFLRCQMAAKQLYAVILEWNHRTAVLFCTDGYSRYRMSSIETDKLISGSDSIDRMIADDEDLETLSALRRALVYGGNSTGSCVLRLKMSDSSSRFTRVSFSRISGDDGKPESTVITLSDIDEQNRIKNEFLRLNTLYHEVVSNVPAGIAIYELRERIYPIFVSERVCELFGYTQRECDLCIANGEPAESMEKIMASADGWREKLSSGEIFEIPRVATENKNGDTVWLRVTCSLTGKNESFPIMYVTLFDITDRVQSEGREHWQSERYRILSELPEAITFDYSPASDVMNVSLTIPGRGFSEETHKDYIKSFSSNNRIAPESKEAYINALINSSAKRLSASTDYRADYYGTGYRWYRATYVSVEDETGCISRVVGRVEDIDDTVRIQSELRRKAQRDTVTGLKNREAAQMLIYDALKNRPDDRFDALLLLDIDNLEVISDTLGRSAGDSVLLSVGNLIKQTFSSNDITARYRGDEFAVYIGSAGDIGYAESKANELLKRLNEIHYPGIGHIRCSIGIVSVTGSGGSLEHYMDKADSALRISKDFPDNKYTVYAEAPGE